MIGSTHARALASAALRTAALRLDRLRQRRDARSPGLHGLGARRRATACCGGLGACGSQRGGVVSRRSRGSPAPEPGGSPGRGLDASRARRRRGAGGGQHQRRWRRSRAARGRRAGGAVRRRDGSSGGVRRTGDRARVGPSGRAGGTVRGYRDHFVIHNRAGQGDRPAPWRGAQEDGAQARSAGPAIAVTPAVRVEPSGSRWASVGGDPVHHAAADRQAHVAQAAHLDVARRPGPGGRAGRGAAAASSGPGRTSRPRTGCGSRRRLRQLAHQRRCPAAAGGTAGTAGRRRCRCRCAACRG